MPFVKGNKMNLGRIFSAESKEKISIARKKYIAIHGAPKFGFKKGHKLGLGKKYRLGDKLSLETKLKMSLSALGKKKSIQHRLNISRSKRGDKSPFWKGGVTPLNKIARESIDYKLWREAVYKRDNYTCQECSVRGGKLNPHHIKPFSLFPELRFAIDNGLTLCESCHQKTDTYGSKIKKYVGTT